MKRVSVPPVLNPKQSRLQRGFTLLEVMVAISITAIIGVGAVQLLSNISEASRNTDIRSEQLAGLQRFNQVITRDLEQFINRSIRDEYGDTQPSLLLDNGDYLLEFTRAGWRNSPVANDPRSTLQRVVYRIEPLDSDECESARLRLEQWGETDPKGDCLVRYFWPHLDRSTDIEVQSQVVLEQVVSLTIELTAETAPTEVGAQPERTNYDSWPPVSDPNKPEYPIAMRWQIELPRLGFIERLWLLAHDKADT
ncbi:type II secretion system minor pseudopilin GspJ [Thalassolituus sp.]|jgi:general secretion pathway protein J|uniref:type II secretion system minor pseudopilin GspJ n=2 Tax=Thalassolituus TaxID=187492 RepID=UPI0032D94ECE